MRDHAVWGAEGPDGMNTLRNLGERFRVRDFIAGPGGGGVQLKLGLFRSWNRVYGTKHHD